MHRLLYRAQYASRKCLISSLMTVAESLVLRFHALDSDIELIALDLMSTRYMRASRYSTQLPTAYTS